MSKVIDNLNDKTIEWIPFSDQVMGGISEVNFVERKEMVSLITTWKGKSVLKIMVVLSNSELK